MKKREKGNEEVRGGRSGEGGKSVQAHSSMTK